MCYNGIDLNSTEDVVNGFALFFSSAFSTPSNVDTTISVDFLNQFLHPPDVWNL